MFLLADGEPGEGLSRDDDHGRGTDQLRAPKGPSFASNCSPRVEQLRLRSYHCSVLCYVAYRIRVAALYQDFTILAIQLELDSAKSDC